MKQRILQNLENSELSRDSVDQTAGTRKFGDRFSPALKRFGALAAMFALLLVGSAAVIQITQDHGNLSTGPSLTTAPSDSAVMEAESEAPAEYTDTAADIQGDLAKQSDIKGEATSKPMTRPGADKNESLTGQNAASGTAAEEESVTLPGEDDTAIGHSSPAIRILVILSIFILLCIAVIIFIRHRTGRDDD